MRRVLTVAFAALCSASLCAQSFTLTLTTPSPSHLTPATTVTCSTTTIPLILDVVRTEALTLTFASTPSSPFSGVTPRRILLVLGVASCNGVLVPATPLPGIAFIDPNAAPAPLFVIDSYSRPFDPVFAPGIAGPSSFAITVGADLFDPQFALPGLPPLTLQAICDDGSGGATPFLLSNAVEFQLVDPAVNFPPAVTGVTSSGSCPVGTPSPSGPETGGSLLTITGTNFLAQSNAVTFPPDVLVGGVPATSVTVVNSTTITAIVPATPFATCPPATSAGAATVAVRNNTTLSPSSTFASAPVNFTYCSGRTPAIGSILPPTIPADGAPITLIGSDFLVGAIVRFTPTNPPGAPVDVTPPPGSFASLGACSTSATTATIVSLQAPPLCSGVVAVQVINPDGQASASTSLQYDAPVILGLTSSGNDCASGSPTPSGAETGGTFITITGINFPAQPNCGAPSITVGGVACTNVVVLNSNAIVAQVPPIPTPSCPPSTSIGSFPVELVTNPPATVPILAPQNFLYCLGRTPTITSITPSHVPADGATVTISGVDFLNGAIVRFTPPPPTGVFDISPPPSAFAAIGACSTTGPSATTVTVTAPPFCSGNVLVEVINLDGQRTAQATLVYDDPVITSVVASGNTCPAGTPAPSGIETGGTLLTLTGVNFPAQANCNLPALTIAGVACSNVVVVDSTTITAVVPPAAMPSCPPASTVGSFPIQLITNPPSVAPIFAPVNFTYCLGRGPVISAVTPSASISPEGGQITISGTDFLVGASVRFTPVGAGTSTTFAPAAGAFANAGSCILGTPTPTTLTIQAPPYCTGPVTLEIINPDQQVTAPFTLTYVELAPTITNAQPTTAVNVLGGPSSYPVILDTGSTLSLTGTNFISGFSPLFGAPTVPQQSSVLAQTRTEIFDAANPQQPLFAAVGAAAGVTSSSSISVTASVGDQTGAWRPYLGVKRLRVVNPRCVRTGNQTELPSNEMDVLVQDANPPSLASVVPNVITPGGLRTLTTSAGTLAQLVSTPVTICGSNFFARTLPAPTNTFGCDCNLTSPTTPACPAPTGGSPAPCSLESTPCADGVSQGFGVVPQLAAVNVPVVMFGGVVAPRVVLLDGNTLIADLPLPLAAPATISVTVINPDGRISNPITIDVVPRLTDPANSLDAVPPLLPADRFHRLDRCALQALAEWNPSVTNVLVGQGLAFLPNPNPAEDFALDNANGNPCFTSNMYDGIFLFNTRRHDGSPRIFDFDAIDVPATIQLATSVNTPFGTISAGPKRVIFKATATEFTASGSTAGFNVHNLVDQNYPFVLRSHGDLRFDGLLNVGGGSLADASTNVLGSPHLFYFRTEFQRPPAGGGLGGHGGAYYPWGLATLPVIGTPSSVRVLPTLPLVIPSPNLGASAAQLAASCGYFPMDREREKLLANGTTTPCGATGAATYVPSGGRGGLGVSPTGGQAGAGAGAGFATPGFPGQAGATLAATAGVTYGSNANVPAATPGRPAADVDIFGATASDFATLLPSSGSAFPSGFFAGGSGGGGGGGSLAIIVPCLSIGGRGGNGGGSVVLLSDRIFALGSHGRIFANGEDGQRGIDAFPIPNQDPLLVLCAPGSGGAGSGGSIFIGAVADAQFPAALPSNVKVLSAMGGIGGRPPQGTTPTTITANGGSAGVGRVRVAVNAHGLTAANALRTTLQSLMVSGNVVPSFCGLTTPAPAQCVPFVPAITSLPLGFVQYP